MKILEAKNLAIQLMQEHGLIQKGWKFQFNERKVSAGLCKFSTKTVFLSIPFIQIRTAEKTKDTILHEIAHALVGRENGHNHIWQAKAKEIGCNGERCFNDAVVEGKYKAVCPNGHIHYLHRKPKLRRSCGKCCKAFNPEFILEFKKIK